VNTIEPQVSLGVVSRSLIVSTTQVDTNVFVAQNMVNIVLPYSSNGYETATMQKVYQNYPDVFDFAIMQSIGRTRGVNIPNYSAVRNNVSGINVPLFDNSASSGSNGVLQGLIRQTPADIINEFSLHEMGHRFANYLNLPALKLTNFTNFHSAYIGTVGQMGGDEILVEQSNGDFLVTQPDGLFSYNSRKYADFELYLMGLAPASAVQPMWFVLNSTKMYLPGEIVPKADVTLVTIDDVISVYGARTPSSSTSQKSFQVLFIGISESPMTLAEVALMNRVAAYYASGAAGQEIDTSGVFNVRAYPSFSAATNGVGTLVTIVPLHK
jgi:hypothetical protein